MFENLIVFHPERNYNKFIFKKKSQLMTLKIENPACKGQVWQKGGH